MNNMIKNQDGSYTKGREDRWAEGVKLVFQVLASNTQGREINVLDVGCGDGSFYLFLKEKDKGSSSNIERINYFGLDSDDIYQKRIKEMGGKFIHSDATNFIKSLGNKKFDVVIASEIIEHVDETDELINQIKSVVKENGNIYLTTPNLAAWHCRLMLLFGFQPLPTEVSNISSTFGKGAIGKKIYKNTIHHIRLFTYKALTDFLKYHKLDIVKVVGSGYRKIDRIIFGNKFIGLAPLIILVLKKRKN